jgi:hypothetical protein
MSFLGGLFKGIVGGVTGFVTGGPLGAVAGAATGIGLRGSSGGGVPSAAALPATRVPTFAPSGPGGVTVFGSPSGFALYHGAGSATAPAQIAPAGCNVKGHHLNRHGYYTKSGFHAPGSTCVKNRRMNVANPRALRRAIRRARGFEKLARKVLGFTSPHRPKGRVYFKHRRRKAA